MTESTEHLELLFECSASDAVWTIRTANFRERLNEPYELELLLDTDALDAEPAQMLGQSVSVSLTRGEMMRQVTGIITAVEEGSTDTRLLSTNITVVPALEALRHRVNTKIFQEMTVPEILEEVLGEGLGAWSRSVDNQTSRTYPTCEYRVQYNESDLDFCQRLMEEEGVVYWFDFEGDTETLILADSSEPYGEIVSLHDSLLLYSEVEADVRGHEYVSELQMTSAMQPTKVATRHFDWTHPSVPIEGESSPSDPAAVVEPGGAHVEPEREVYEHDERPLTLSEYDGAAFGANDVDDQVKLWREAQVWPARVARGRSTVTAMRIGAVFDVLGHPRADLDGRYLVLGVTHHITEQGAVYGNAFECIPADVVFRPRRTRRKPRIASIQTATVTGPAGEEIHTDEHGRIKVQFHWDRLGTSDENSSCWVRVQQPWAGAGWGFVFIPRMGMEVIVDFVNGDPDRPVVMGSVYNADNPPPYPLPDEKTKSTIKTNTSLGGGGYNELRFEDKAGEEEIFTHAQKDQNEVVLNDHTTTVHHDQTNTVGNDQTQDIGNNQTEHVGANQDMTVDANRTVQVHGDYSETIDGSETRTVSSGVTETIDAGETRTITGGMTEEITGGREQTINGSSTETIAGSLDQTINAGASITTPASYTITAAGGAKFTAQGGSTYNAPAGYTLIAPGGNTTHDLQWLMHGSTYVDIYGYKASYTTFKLEACITLAAALNGFTNGKKGTEMAAGIMELGHAGNKFTDDGATVFMDGINADTDGLDKDD